MLIVVDSREQCPFPFTHERYEAQVQPGTLTVGDYSLAGLEDKVAVERKSLPDLVACLGRERERFARLAAMLDAMSPLKVLGRGYAIPRREDGTVLRSARQAHPGEELSLRLSDGEISCKVI